MTLRNNTISYLFTKTKAFLSHTKTVKTVFRIKMLKLCLVWKSLPQVSYWKPSLCTVAEHQQVSCLKKKKKSICEHPPFFFLNAFKFQQADQQRLVSIHKIMILLSAHSWPVLLKHFKLHAPPHPRRNPPSISTTCVHQSRCFPWYYSACNVTLWKQKNVKFCYCLAPLSFPYD